MLGLWLKADSSGFLLRRRRRHAGVSALKFDGVSEDMLPRSDSLAMVLFLANYFGGP